ncbi:hypothetical protein [Alienimonas californiensis]|uniref:hypothetical protein n=1 Tax=Alienimonas californiensis TaxID=2527989 RepID=UPI0011AB0035|nr:hypothetical protein [Alienimonas californiensis]
MSHLLIAPLLAAALSQVGPPDANPADAAPAGPTPEQEDANLHALHLAGPHAWACGDRGAVWRSADAGRTWAFQPTPTAWSLRSLSFVTGNLGWAAGGGVEAFTGDSVGVVLNTTDGGATWERIDATPLPNVVAIRFFTPERGLAACEPTDAAPSGLWTTEDGGAVWTALPGPRLGHWRAAALTGPEQALLVGERGRIALSGGGALTASPAAPGGLPALNAVTAAGAAAFACGENGRVWTTRTAGRAWELLPGPLPTNGSAAGGPVAQDLDLRGVWAGGPSSGTPTLAVCGDPGGVIFVRSPGADGRPGWTAGGVAGTAPLNAVAFSQVRTERGEEPYGLAVGDLGAIVRTAAKPAEAAAVGWNTVRGGGRRAAALAIVADPAEGPFLALAATAAADGHRAVVLCPVRRDLGAAAVRPAGEAGRLDSAVLTAGGSAGLLSWDFPLTVPGAEADPAVLVREWNDRHEGDGPTPGTGGGAGPRLARRLARAIRTWRPSVVLLPAADPSANPRGSAFLVRKAAEQALQLAADPTRLSELDQLGLRPWRVARVLERRPDGDAAAVAVRAADPLRTLGGTAGDLAASARSQIISTGDASPAPAAEGFRPVELPTTVSPPARGDALFAGLHLAAGGPARRWGRPRVEPPDSGVVLRRRLLTAAADRIAAGAATSLVGPEDVTANLRPLAAGVPAALAAADLARLAELLLEAGEIDAAEAVLIELANRFSAEPAAHAALPELMRLWCGSERASLRLDPNGVQTVTTTRDAVVTAGAARAADPRVETADMNVDRGVGHSAALRKGQLEGVLRLGALLEQRAPRRFATRQVQRPLAAARRQLGVPTPPGSPAAAILTGDDPTAFLPCGISPAVPRLDGALSDPCWRAAEAVTLSDPAGRSRGGLVMTARDDRFLFLAASLPIDPRAPLPAVNMTARGHDEPTAPHDRLELELDIDRDLGTAWRLTIAADGAVAEDCCGDPSWNPRCAVHVSREAGATADDPGAWRIELAIPLSELAPEPPPIGATWALRMRRVTPGVGAADWPPPPADAVALTDDADRPFGALRWAK